MKKVTSKNCIRCGSEKGETPSGCGHWGTYYKKHIFTYMKAETKEERETEETEFKFALLKIRS